MKRKVEITVETERVRIVRRAGIVLRASCPECTKEAQMVTAESAARLCQRTLRWVVGQAETGALHFTETQDGLLFICLNSLLAVLRRG